MKLFVIGVNHKTAPIALRERLAFSSDEILIALDQLQNKTDGTVILSTCNRTEIYLLFPDLTVLSRDNDLKYESILDEILNWLAGYKFMPLAQLRPYIYIYRHHEALTHWIRVASGLDSMILGEPQILGQIKKSVNFSYEHGNVSNKFSWIVDQVFSSAKRVRHDTKVGSQAVTLGFATARLATQIFDDLSQCHLLIVAAGEMNRLVANHIVGQNIGKITICNRNQERANLLATELKQINKDCSVSIQPLTELENCLIDADIVSSCSGSMQTLISFNMCKKLMKKRRYRSMLMVDLAVPRDVEDKVNDLDEVYLYSIDDLQHVIAGNIEQRRQAAVDAEILVSQMVVEIESRFQVRQVGSDIYAYRETANQYAEKILAESMQKLQQGDQSAEFIIQEMSRRLTQTLTHAPSKLMRTVASKGDHETLEMVVSTLSDAYRGS